MAGSAALAARNAPLPLRADLPFPITGTVNVVVTSLTGTQFYAGPATYDATTYEWTATVPQAATATPGTVNVVWTHSTGPTAATEIDVRDGNPFPMSKMNQHLARGGPAGVYTDAAKRRALEDALLELEDACRVCLVPKRSTLPVTGAGYSLFSDYANPLRVVTAPGGLAVSDCTVDTPSGLITFASIVTGPTTITIDHGLEGMSQDVARHVSLLAAYNLIDGPFDDRGMAHVEGGGMVQMLTAGVRNAKFSIPAVQAFYLRTREIA